MTTLPESKLHELNESSSCKLCAICLMDPDPNNTIILQCTHVFCKDCLFQWKKGTCPICRYCFSLKELNLDEYKKSIHKWINNITSKSLTSTYTLVKELLEIKQKEYDDINCTVRDQIIELTFYRCMDKLTSALTQSIRSRSDIDTMTSSVEISNKSLQIIHAFNDNTYVIFTQTMDEFEHELLLERTIISDNERIKRNEMRQNELQKRLGYQRIL